ncbi:hypothetical protein S40285_00337 [Stachybotrys chlorohalonatus IBT 40285]|uniref:Uncharacterized protein n=1 Tax=Stachybotrys chlorohalonatus (strain IBT 40285) TaxID=1283841 RepID=A0A084QHS4_STAC4|nr:hypothetical protein S40285_00337 [Stachybotrys chlorohalonata IBT 40285]
MAAKAQSGRQKVVHQLESPLSAVSWPEITIDDQDTILELLCDLLSPLGQYRRTHIQPSKGKRALRRKRKVADGAGQASTGATNRATPPNPPEMAAKVDVGFNKITRVLQEASSTGREAQRAYSMVFVARGNQSPAFNCHFPVMVGAASKSLPPDRQTRLVGFSKPCSERLSSCLGIARVSAVAIVSDEPVAAALWSFVQKAAAPVQMPWPAEAQEAAYKATQIKSFQTPVGTKRARPS